MARFLRCLIGDFATQSTRDVGFRPQFLRIQQCSRIAGSNQSLSRVRVGILSEARWERHHFRSSRRLVRPNRSPYSTRLIVVAPGPPVPRLAVKHPHRRGHAVANWHKARKRHTIATQVGRLHLQCNGSRCTLAPPRITTTASPGFGSTPGAPRGTPPSMGKGCFASRQPLTGACWLNPCGYILGYEDGLASSTHVKSGAQAPAFRGGPFI